MRGSPLNRFIILVVALSATGVELSRITAARGNSEPVKAAVIEGRASAATPFHLVLSAPAASVEIDTGWTIHPALDQPLVSGTLTLEPNNPHVGLVVRWKSPAAAGEHRFAKLTLEAPGQETFTHVFDAGGDIDDFLELPFPAEK